MKRLLFGILIGMGLMATPTLALRTERPPEFQEWNTNTFAQLNNLLLGLWNTLNGRYQVDRVTTDPDGSRPCSVGELVYFDTGTDQLCVCANASTKQWVCATFS